MYPRPVTGSFESANLDLLRTLAVSTVFFGHLAHTFGRSSEPLEWLAHWGVLIFFVHTSLVLMMSMERLHLTGWRLFANFYTRRAFRIYPLSILCVLTLYALKVPGTNWPTIYPAPGWRDVLADVALVQNVTDRVDVSSPMWSLPYEVQMYLVLPFVFLLVSRYRSLKSAAILWIAGTIISIEAPHLGRHLGMLAHYAPCFFAGVVAYQLRRWTPRRILPSWTWPVLIVAIGCVFAFTNFEFHFGIKWDKLRLGWLLCLALGLLAGCCREVQAKWLRAAAHNIAKYSYGIYLSHLPIMWLAFIYMRSESVMVRWSVFVILAAAVPVLAYHFLEKPMIGAGIALSRRWTAARAPARENCTVLVRHGTIGASPEG